MYMHHLVLSSTGTECGFQHFILQMFMEVTLLHWAIVFLVISLIAGFFGFSGVSQAAAGISKLLFVLFLIVFVVLLIIGMRVVA